MVGRKSSLIVTLGATKQRKPELCSWIHRKSDRNSGWSTSVRMKYTQKSCLLSQMLFRSLKKKNKKKEEWKKTKSCRILQEKFWQLLCYMWSWRRIVYKAFWFFKNPFTFIFFYSYWASHQMLELAPHLLNSWDNSALFNCNAIWKLITVRRSGFFLPSLSAFLGKGIQKSDI